MRAFRILVAVCLILASFGVATPVAAGDPCYHGFDQPDRSESTDPQVKLMPCAFAPTVIRVAPGTTVEFFSGPGEVHLITGAGQEWGSRDDEIQPDSMVSYRFDRGGIYPYACALHRGMSGAIVVGDGVAKPSESGSGPAVVTVVGPKAAASASAAAAGGVTAASTRPGAGGSAAATAASAPATSSAVPPFVLLALAVVVLAVLVLAGGRFITRRSRGTVLEG